MRKLVKLKLPNVYAPFILPFSEIHNKDIAIVGGKNASLGEMLSTLGDRGIRIPDGFATTADAFRFFLKENHNIYPLLRANIYGDMGANAWCFA